MSARSEATPKTNDKTSSKTSASNISNQKKAPKRPSEGKGPLANNRKGSTSSNQSKKSTGSGRSKPNHGSRRSPGNSRSKRHSRAKARGPKTFLQRKEAAESQLSDQERQQRRQKERALLEKYSHGLVDHPPEVDESAEELYVEEEPESFETTKYGMDLHSSLQWMWVVMKVFGKIPFGIGRHDREITFNRNRISVHYILAFFNAFILLILVSWLTVGICFMFFSTHPPFNTECLLFSQVLQQFEQMYVLRYILEVFLIWTSLFHAMVSSIHLVCQEMKYAGLFREWYLLSDRCQFRIYSGVRAFIVRQYLILVMTLAVLVGFYVAPKHVKWFPPTVYNTCSVVGLCIVKLIDTKKFKMHDEENRRIVHDRYAWVGLLLFFVAIINSRLNLISFMVSCRLLANTGTHFNKRMNMALENEPAEGALAVRLRRNLLYQDHNAICFMARKIGRVYSWSLTIYYVLQVASILCELIVIGVHQYRDEYNNYKWYNMPNSTHEYLLVGDDSRHKFISHVGHLLLTVTSFLHITYIAIRASDKCMIVYEIVRRHGLHKCEDEEERNFIRSMWMSGDSKRKIIIAPGSFFDLGRPFILTLLTEILLYYVHILPFRHELVTRTGMKTFTDAYDSYKESNEYNKTVCKVDN